MPAPEPYDDDIARMYDLLVEGREDAEAEGRELEFIRRALAEVCPRPVQDVLDVGCGTGKHLIPLVRDGLCVTGLDYSEAMVRECGRKLARRGLEAELRTASPKSSGSVAVPLCGPASERHASVSRQASTTERLKRSVLPIRLAGMFPLRTCR